MQKINAEFYLEKHQNGAHSGIHIWESCSPLYFWQEKSSKLIELVFSQKKSSRVIWIVILA